MVGGLAGVAAVDRWDLGYFPFWEAEAYLAWRWEADTGAHQLAGGGFLGKSLSPHFYVPEGSYAESPLQPLEVRLGGLQTWSPAEGKAGLLLVGGLQTATYAGKDY
jgi:hypothetical protein